MIMMEMINPCDMGMVLVKHEVTEAQQTCKVGSRLILQNSPERLNDFSKVTLLIIYQNRTFVYVSNTPSQIATCQMELEKVA